MGSHQVIRYTLIRIVMDNNNKKKCKQEIPKYTVITSAAYITW